MSLRPRSPPPQQSRGTKRVVRSASPQTLSEKRARSVGITAGNAFRAEVERNVKKEMMIPASGVEDDRKRRGEEDGREWRDAEKMEETKRVEKARHRVEEDRSKEVGGKEARRKVTRRDAVRKKIAGLLKIAVGRVAFTARLVEAG